MNTRTLRRSSALLLTSIVLAGGAGLTALPAASAAPEPGQGWLRLGHLSPDTKAVDVEVSALSGGSARFELEGVGYGDLSPYTQLPAGTYTVSVVPAGAIAASAPVIAATVEVKTGSAETVVAYGRSAELAVKAFTDDLSQPTAGNGRIRLVQASTVTPEVDVKTSTGRTIATRARAGEVTGYAEVPAGAWTLELTGAEAEGTTKIDVAAGSVTTLFVLDTADGDLTVLPVVDSASVGIVPDGGVDTGAGGLAGGLTPVAERATS